MGWRGTGFRSDIGLDDVKMIRGPCPEDTNQEKLVCNPEEEFKCNAEERCIPIAYKCDGIFDCVDSEDETDCPVAPTGAMGFTDDYSWMDFTTAAAVTTPKPRPRARATTAGVRRTTKPGNISFKRAECI